MALPGHNVRHNLRMLQASILASATAAALSSPSATNAASKSPPTASCWQAQDEVQNDLRASGSVPRLPTELQQERVKRAVVAFKLCIDQGGDVVRIVTTTSSGNTKIDAFFRDSLAKWRYHPRRVGAETRPSVAFVTVTFAVLP